MLASFDTGSFAGNIAAVGDFVETENGLLDECSQGSLDWYEEGSCLEEKDPQEDGNFRKAGNFRLAGCLPGSENYPRLRKCLVAGHYLRTENLVAGSFRWVGRLLVDLDSPWIENFQKGGHYLMAECFHGIVKCWNSVQCSRMLNCDLGAVIKRRNGENLWPKEHF